MTWNTTYTSVNKQSIWAQMCWCNYGRLPHEPCNIMWVSSVCIWRLISMDSKWVALHATWGGLKGKFTKNYSNCLRWQCRLFACALSCYSTQFKMNYANQIMGQTWPQHWGCLRNLIIICTGQLTFFPQCQYFVVTCLTPHTRSIRLQLLLPCPWSLENRVKHSFLPPTFHGCQ